MPLRRWIWVVSITAMVAAVGGVRPVQCASCPEFSAAANYGDLSAPTAVAVGDVNRDGQPDVAVANGGADTVSILIGQAGGTFTAAVEYPTGAGPTAILLIDVNRDGKLDVAVTNTTTSTVSVLLGNGDGTFAAKIDTAAGTSPRGLAAADFNQDDKPDLVTASSATNTLAILIGEGDGTFSAGATPATGAGPVAVVSGDFNRDGLPDLATANSSDNSVSILRATGLGAFSSPIPVSVGTGPSALAIGDFNRDGKMDITVANGGSASVSFLIGNGTGSFTVIPAAVVGSTPASLAVGDITGDAKPDVIVANSGSGSLSFLVGDGTGSFIVVPAAVVGTTPASVVPADFNGDGKVDVATANTGSNNLSIVLNTGVCAINCGTFATALDFTTAGVTSRALGDFDRDGTLDLAFAVSNGGFDERIVIATGQGDGHFFQRGQLGSSRPYAIATADFNRDGRLDLAAAKGVLGASAPSNVAIHLAEGSGFANNVDYSMGPCANPTQVVVADFNNDGTADLLIPQSSCGTVTLLLGNGDGTFAAASNISAGGSPIGVVAADFNRDGKADFALTTANGVAVRLGDGAGGFNAAVDYGVGTTPRFLTAGDFNVDGKMDLAVANAGSNNVSVLLGDGAGTFASAVNYAVGSGPESVVTADFNGDGKPDIAAGNASSNNGTMLVGAGDGTFPSSYTVLLGGATRLSAADVNRDGRPDLIGGAVNHTAIALNTCPAPDVKVTKVHFSEPFYAGGGGSFRIFVTNVGSLPTAGIVTLTDSSPSDLIARHISGTGWTCTLSTLTCTRSDALGASASSWIDVSFDVRTNSGSQVTNLARVSGGGETNPLNNSASDTATISHEVLMPPTSVVAVATSTSQVAITWDAVTWDNGTGAISYQVERSDHGGAYGVVATVGNTIFYDGAVSAGTTYLYRVKTVNGATVSPESKIQLATTIMFTDDPLTTGTTPMKAVHIAELRAAVDAVRAAAGLAAGSYTYTVIPGTVVRAVDITEMRTNLNAAYGAIQGDLRALSYTDPGLTAGFPIKAVYLQELRSGVK